jgi:two-component sensor histidine kinase
LQYITKMGYKVLLAGLLLASALILRAQHIGRRQADSLSAALKKDRGDISDLYALLQLADYNIQKRGEGKADLDSAADFITQARQLNGRLRSGVGYGYIALMEAILDRERRQKAEGKLAAQQGVALLSKENDAALLGKAYYELSEFYDYNLPAEQSTKIEYIQKALHCYEQAGVLERQGYCLERLCDIYYNSRQQLEALKYGKLAIERYKAAHYPNLQGPYILLANVYIAEGDYQQGAYYGLLSLQSAVETNDSTMQLCQINYTVGLNYSFLADYSKSLKYFWAAINVAFHYRDTANVDVCALALAGDLVRTGQPHIAISFLDSIYRYYGAPKSIEYQAKIGTVYMGAYGLLRNFSREEVYCDSLLKTCSKSEDWTKYQVYITAMRFFIMSSQLKRARDTLPAFHELVSRLNIEVKKNYIQILYRLDTAEHHYKAAIDNIFKYYALKDSLAGEQKSRQIQELQVAYETSEKERNIVVLQKEGEMQKLDLLHTKDVRNLFIAGVGLSLLLLGVLWNRYRLKQQKNRELETQQKEITEKNSQLELSQRQISDKNTQLQKLLGENEILLREVHHRVKNNLQIVMSLLTSQSAFLQDPKALSAVKESKHRVQAMALIHQRLYQSSDVTVVLMPEYITDLVYYLRDSFADGRRVIFDLKVEPISLDVLQAVPVGLILNELVTNAFKYAFPHTSQDAITVRLQRTADGVTELFVADNGRGFPPGYDPAQSRSYGMLLIQGLVNDLGGSLERSHDQGTAYWIRFGGMDVS